MMVSLDKAGRLVIPKPIRDALDLGPEAELTIHVEGDSIRIGRAPGRERRLAFTPDGRPFFAAGDDDETLSDLDVQRLRDAQQR